MMRPLLLVNWRAVHAGFCLLMWVVAFVLALYILAHASGATPVHHAPLSRVHHPVQMVK